MSNISRTSEHSSQKSFETNSPIDDTLPEDFDETDLLTSAVTPIDLRRLPALDPQAYRAAEELLAHEGLIDEASATKKRLFIGIREEQERQKIQRTSAQSSDPNTKNQETSLFQTPLQFSSHAKEMSERVQKDLRKTLSEKEKVLELNEEQTRLVQLTADFTADLKEKLKEHGMTASSEDLDLAFSQKIMNPNLSTDHFVMYVKGLQKGNILGIKKHEGEYQKLNDMLAVTVKELQVTSKSYEKTITHLNSVMNNLKITPGDQKGKVGDMPTNVQVNLPKAPTKDQVTEVNPFLAFKLQGTAQGSSKSVQVGTGVSEAKTPEPAFKAPETLDDYCLIMRMKASKLIAVAKGVLPDEMILSICQKIGNERWLEASKNIKIMESLRIEIIRSISSLRDAKESKKHQV
ncbi:TPA_asm: protein 2 [Erysimum virus 1]|uniref:Protein 2 n=1 Tax=Erysimum virus 1 TaxID=2977967 RepID=A0A9N6YIW6_9RHAB|nr:TPA_asm: protein 2 [Erysimum virus 1]